MDYTTDGSVVSLPLFIRDGRKRCCVSAKKISFLIASTEYCVKNYSKNVPLYYLSKHLKNLY